ncbi:MULTISPECIES: hypothetical protein [unclassified Sphingomonas]|uniref:hypothetical protein n=1 Tax=unclassified Sphingomonas TaxID=196159 RepID=UPI000701AA15|nr:MULTISPECIES: hypothetical protein [unclassified Sphingomonas]KQM62040.1 hypothetical protein ASE65_03170 [Sphingomonas sp. Leaf16]KQN13441.1 hypothetical protein ASE81_03240 [Sphingomonas sp. Leaf29]KQN23324.1 hypothetical protein ASE83_02170 [Sphingomonas sp. Leaf32]
MLAIWLAVQAATVPAVNVWDDLRCIASISQSFETAAPSQRAILTAGMVYFIGRVEGASPATDIAASVQRIRRAPGAKAALDAAALPCAKRISARMTLFAKLDPGVTKVEPAR